MHACKGLKWGFQNNYCNWQATKHTPLNNKYRYHTKFQNSRKKSGKDGTCGTCRHLTTRAKHIARGVRARPCKQRIQNIYRNFDL